MNVDAYYQTYLRPGIFSMAQSINKLKHLQEELKEKRCVECWLRHPSFDKVQSYKIVKCGKIWVLLGKVLCNFIDGQKIENFELAFGMTKNELLIWKDLHCV